MLTVSDLTWLLVNRDNFNRELSVLGLTREKVQVEILIPWVGSLYIQNCSYQNHS
jgi:hypothetical protein